MYTYHIIALLLASTALAAPNHAARDMPIAADSVLPSITAPAAALPTQATVAGETVIITKTLIVWPSPVPEPEPLAGVYICTDINWGGTCEHLLHPPGGTTDSCVVLDGTASSIGPDPGFVCYFYDNSFCESIRTDGEDFVALAYPGSADLSTVVKGSWNDRAYSYQCFKN